MDTSTSNRHHGNGDGDRDTAAGDEAAEVPSHFFTASKAHRKRLGEVRCKIGGRYFVCVFVYSGVYVLLLVGAIEWTLGVSNLLYLTFYSSNISIFGMTHIIHCGSVISHLMVCCFCLARLRLHTLGRGCAECLSVERGHAAVALH